MSKAARHLAEKIGIRSIRGGKGVIRAYTKEQSYAHDLYVFQKKTQTEVSQIVGISQATMCKWVGQFNWKEEQEARHLSPVTIHTEIMRNNAEIVKRLGQLNWQEDAETAKKEYVKLMDALSKGQAVANSIMRQYDSLSGILLAMDEFTNWLANNENRKKNHPDLMAQLELYLPAFGRAMAEKFN